MFTDIDLNRISGVETASDLETSLQVHNDNIIDVSYEYEYPEFIEAIENTGDCKEDETVKDYYNRIFDKYIKNSESLLASIRRIEDKKEDDFNDTLLRKVWEHLAKDSQIPYDNQKTPLERVVNDLKCIDVTEQWPSNQKRRRGKRRRRGNQTDKEQILNNRIEKYLANESLMSVLQEFLPQVNEETVDQTLNKTVLQRLYKDKGAKQLIKDVAEAKRQKEIRDKYTAKLNSYKETIQENTLPKLKLSNLTEIKMDNLNQTNITYKINLFQENEKYSVIFGENNFILKYGNTVDKDNLEKLFQGNKNRNRFNIKNNIIIVDEKNTKTIDTKNINTLQKAQVHFLEESNGGLEIKEKQITAKRPQFLKAGLELNDEQAFVVQQKPQNWLIFHDPGVGKTLNALAVAVKNLNEEGNIHVIAPSKSILSQWEQTYKNWIKKDTKITLTTQTQAMFIKVCSEGTKGSFYDFGTDDKLDDQFVIDDKTLQKIKVTDKTFDFCPNVKTLLNQIGIKQKLSGTEKEIFEKFFLDQDFFLKDFVRSFWSYCFLSASKDTIDFFANVVYDRNVKSQNKIDMFRPINQFDEKTISKQVSFNIFFIKTSIPIINKKDFKDIPYVDYGMMKIKIINDKINTFLWSKKKHINPIDYFPMLGKNTILIIDESHNVVSDNLEKKSVRYVSDIGRHCKHIICCSATPFNSADGTDYQMYAYGRILNKDPIHYYNVAESKEQRLLDGLELVRNKVTGRKKVTDEKEQEKKINMVLRRLTEKGNLRTILKNNQDLLFRRLNYDFFDFFKPLTNFYGGGGNTANEKVAGLTEKSYIHLSPEFVKYVADENVDFAKRRILYRQLQFIFTIDNKKTKDQVYPTVKERVIMFSFQQGEKSKRFPEIKKMNMNDYMVAYKSKEEKYPSIKKNWNKDNKIRYCYPSTTNTITDIDFENDDETSGALTVFSEAGFVNPEIFVPDLIPSKIKFMVEEALENIILNHKNVMIYSFLKMQNKYNKEVFKMYNVKEITIVTGKKTTKDNVIATLEKAEIIKDNTLIQSVGFKLQLKWTSKDWNTLIEENGEKTFANRDKSQLEKKLDLLETTGINIALSEELGGYNDVVENINNTEDDVLEAKKKKSKIWKQRILGEGALPYYIAKPIDGDVTSVEERKVIEELFSIGILDICLISDAGAQGTDFKSTRESMMYVASTDGRAVPANIMQFKGRLNRKYSHAICPPDKRTVTYTRICLYKSVRAYDGQCQRMSHFFYYKVPKKGFAIDFLYTQDFADTNEYEFPKKCPFCNLLKGTGNNTCECGVESQKQYYYLKQTNEDNVQDLHNKRIITPVSKRKDENIYCKEFDHYNRFLKRLLNLELVTLLLKTESFEHNYYAQQISSSTDQDNMRFMAIKEEDYWYLKRICYKGELPQTINKNPKSPIKTQKNPNPEGQSDRIKKKAFIGVSKSKGLDSESKLDEIGGKPSTRRDYRRRGRGRGTSGRRPGTSGGGRGSTTTNVNLTYPENNMIVEVEWLEDENTQEKKWYVGQYLIDENGVENVFYFGSTYPWKPYKQPWRFYDPGVKVGEFFRFLWSTYTGVYELLEIRDDENGDPNIYYFDTPKRKGIDFNVTINAIVKVDLLEDQGGDDEYSDFSEVDGDNQIPVVRRESSDDENSNSDKDLFDDPVDSILASYPYLSL